MCSIAATLILGSLIWKVPHRGIPDSITDEKVKADLLNANRDNFLKGIQAIAGLGFVVTAVLAWRNLQLTEDKNVTDRFSKAVEMLADNGKLEVRLGGIYSLERIARDSKADPSVVMEVLTAFVRARGAPEEGKKPLSQDIQSALTVIGRRTPIENEQTIDLSGANLSGANLFDANLSKGNLIGADLCGANLCEANFSGANLFQAKLSGAALYHANLSGVDLVGANLVGIDLVVANLAMAKLIYANLSDAKLIGADLSGANLIGADLSGANLSSANLSSANLSHAILIGTILIDADLSGAKLHNADLESIICDEKTIWPDITEVAQARNIPAALKTQLSIDVTPPAGPGQH